MISEGDDHGLVLAVRRAVLLLVERMARRTWCW